MPSDKNIDENWKESVKRAKAAEEEKKEEHLLEPNFNAFLSSMAMEAFIFLGEVPNPITKKKEASLPQARYVIDTIAMIKEKTKGNLTADEANNIDNILYELKVKYVAKSG